jgi:hypothetical protein
MDEATRELQEISGNTWAAIRKLRERIEQLEASNAELRERVFGE